MKNLILLVGPPGSGKSTLAKKDKGFLRISQDDMGKEGHLMAFKNALSQSLDIIVDRMGFNKEQRSRYLTPAKEAGYTTKIIVLHENAATCRKRMRSRLDHPTIKNEHDAGNALNTFFTKYERVEDSEADSVERLWPQNLVGTCIVSDIDNTLANCDHREHFVTNLPEGKKKDWKAFFDAMGEDPVNEWCKEIINNWGLDTLLVSARPDDYRQKTEDWLYKHGILYNNLIMRRRGDFREDSIVKEILLEFEIKTKYKDVLFWLDDRKRVIDKIRSHSITVLDCKGNEF